MAEAGIEASRADSISVPGRIRTVSPVASNLRVGPQSIAIVRLNFVFVL